MTFTPTLSEDDDRPDQGDGDGVDTVIVAKPKSKTQRPSMYKVLLLNDDYTPMEFVVLVLERFFGITNQHAVELMLTVHRRGVAHPGPVRIDVERVLHVRREAEHRPRIDRRPAQPPRPAPPRGWACAALPRPS